MGEIGGVHAPALGQGSKAFGASVIRHVFPRFIHGPIEGRGQGAPLHGANAHHAHAGGPRRLANRYRLAGLAETIEVSRGVQCIGDHLHHRRSLRRLKGAKHRRGVADARDAPGFDQPFGLKRLEGRDDGVVVAALPSGKAILHRGNGRVWEGVVVGDDIAVEKVQVDVIAP